MSPKKGNFFPSEIDRDSVPENFPAMVAKALQAELGKSHRAAKTLMRWTGASERTVKHWLSGAHGPRGEHLVALLRESDAVFDGVMIAADREDVALAARVLTAQISLDNLLARLGEKKLRSRLQCRQNPTADGSDDEDDLENDRHDDPENDRDPNREVRPIRSPRGAVLNPRQRWYLDVLGSGMDVRAADLTRCWKISDKTARRDIAGLKALGMISFVGSRRAGRYRITS